MISKQDILDRAAEWQLRPEVVEKDYVLGWLLAALASYPEMRSHWVFKGGTCIKKCFFETYRFSEDLDFSLRTEAPYGDAAIKEMLVRLVSIAGEISGVRFPIDLIVVRPRQDKLGRLTFEGRIAYQGPLNIPTFPRVLMDITQHEPVFDPPSSRVPFHPYPDALPADLTVLTYSLEELIAEKTRALYERTRPRDLYDVIFLIENHFQELNMRRILELFRQKCIAKNREIPSANELLRIVENAAELRSEWANMLAHQLPALPILDDLLQRLPGLIGWIDQPEIVLPAAALASPSVSAGEELIAPSGIQYWESNIPLEVVRFSGANRLLIDFVYDGKPRRAEPYSLRRAQTGNILLYAWEQGSTHIKAFNVQRIQNMRTTNITFQPRYRVEFTIGGLLQTPDIQRSSPRTTFYSPSSRLRKRAGGPTYIFECSYCQKKFRHATNTPTLRKHKSKDGNWDCPGRRGYLVDTEWG